MSQPEAPSPHASIRVQLPPELSSFHAYCLQLSDQPEHRQFLRQISAEVLDRSIRFESFQMARLDWISANLLKSSTRLDGPATSALLECRDFLERHPDLDEGGKISQALTSQVIAQYRLDSQPHENTTEHAPITKAQYLQLQKDIDEILDRACYEIHKYKKQIPALQADLAALTADNSRLIDETVRLSEENKDLRRRLSAFALRTPVSFAGSPQQETADIDTPQSTGATSASQAGSFSSTPQQPPASSTSLLWSSVLQWQWPHFVAPKLDKEDVKAVRNSLSRFWRKHGIPAPGSRYYLVPSHLTNELLAEAAEHAGDILDKLGKPKGDFIIGGGSSASNSSSSTSSISGISSALVHPLEEVEGAEEEEEEDVRGWRPWLDLVREQWPQFLLHRFEHRGGIWNLVSQYCSSHNLTTHMPSQLFLGKPVKAIPPWLAEDFLEAVTGRFGEALDSQFGVRTRRKRRHGSSSSSSSAPSPDSAKKHKATDNGSGELVGWPDIVRSKWPNYSSREDDKIVARLAYQFCTNNGLKHQQVLTERKQKSVGIPAALAEEFLDHVTRTAGVLLDKRFPNTATAAPGPVPLADGNAGRGESQAPGPREKLVDDSDWVACADLVRRVWPSYLASHDTVCPPLSLAFCKKHNLNATVKSPTTGKWCRAVPRNMGRLFLEELLREAGEKLEARWGPPMLAENGLVRPEK